MSSASVTGKRSLPESETSEDGEVRCSCGKESITTQKIIEGDKDGFVQIHRTTECSGDIYMNDLSAREMREEFIRRNAKSPELLPKSINTYQRELLMLQLSKCMNLNLNLNLRTPDYIRPIPPSVPKANNNAKDEKKKMKKEVQRDEKEMANNKEITNQMPKKEFEIGTKKEFLDIIKTLSCQDFRKLEVVAQLTELGIVEFRRMLALKAVLRDVNAELLQPPDFLSQAWCCLLQFPSEYVRLCEKILPRDAPGRILERFCERTLRQYDSDAGRQQRAQRYNCMLEQYRYYLEEDPLRPEVASIWSYDECGSPPPPFHVMLSGSQAPFEIPSSAIIRTSSPAPAAAPAAALAPAPVPLATPANKLTLRVKDCLLGNNRFLTLQVGKNTPLQKVFDVFAKERGVVASTLQFQYNSTDLSGTATPKSLNLTEKGEITVNLRT